MRMTQLDTLTQNGLVALNYKARPLTLKDIHECNRTCVGCYLAKTRTQVVPGVGRSTAKIVLVGEAPGADEDIEGIPFFGRCGKLLTKLLLRAKLNREEMYITNTVCCRPPNNKLSKDEQEINSCKMWLWHKLRTIQPEIIVLFGKVPTRLLLKLKKTFKLADYVGVPHKIDGLSGLIYPWYHPSFLLQHGKRFEEDTVTFFGKIGAKCLVS